MMATDQKNQMFEEAAQKLRRAMKGIGCDDSVLVEVLGPASYVTCMRIVDAYTKSIKRDLIADLKDETHFNFKDVMLALITERARYDAKCLHDAIKGWINSDESLIELICTRSPDDIKAMIACYEQEYKTSALADIDKDMKVFGDYGKLLTTVLKSDRTKAIDKKNIPADVEALFQAGEGKKLGTDETVFIRIFGNSPRSYLDAVNAAYIKQYGHSLEAIVDSETSFSFKKALIALVQPLPEYFADRLFDAMKGAGTRDASLIRIIVTQKERRLKEVAQVFLTKYKSTLSKWIEEETSGAYRAALLSILKHHGGEPQLG